MSSWQDFLTRREVVAGGAVAATVGVACTVYACRRQWPLSILFGREEVEEPLTMTCALDTTSTAAGVNWSVSSNQPSSLATATIGNRKWVTVGGLTGAGRTFVGARLAGLNPSKSIQRSSNGLTVVFPTASSLALVNIPGSQAPVVIDKPNDINQGRLQARNRQDIHMANIAHQAGEVHIAVCQELTVYEQKMMESMLLALGTSTKIIVIINCRYAKDPKVLETKYKEIQQFYPGGIPRHYSGAQLPRGLEAVPEQVRVWEFQNICFFFLMDDREKQGKLMNDATFFQISHEIFGSTTTKERKSHQLVVDYIADCCNQTGSREKVSFTEFANAAGEPEFFLCNEAFRQQKRQQSTTGRHTETTHRVGEDVSTTGSGAQDDREDGSISIPVNSQTNTNAHAIGGDSKTNTGFRPTQAHPKFTNTNSNPHHVTAED